MKLISDSNCPFAQEAIERGKVAIVRGNKTDIIRHVISWDDSLEVLVIIPSWKNYYHWCIANEERFARDNLIAIPNQKEGYILLQRLTDLVEASDNLMKTGYYDNFTSEQFSHVLRRKELIKSVIMQQR